MTTATYNQIVEAIGRRKTYSINENLDVYTTREKKRGEKKEKSLPRRVGNAQLSDTARIF